jgi:TetR/AcrR family transcriptional regulator, multidrug resistance operon repressor
MRIRDENKKTAISEKAMEMIAAVGFDGLSMQKLAKAANVSPATIYIYYKSREDLLNQLFNDAHHTFSEVALEGFDPLMPFEEGLWLQWKNRQKFIIKYPIQFNFCEQFRNCGKINHCDVKYAEYRETMKHFVDNSIKRGEMKKMEPELFWSMAYGPFYSLVKFHLQHKSITDTKFTLTDAKMKLVFKMVVKGFAP